MGIFRLVLEWLSRSLVRRIIVQAVSVAMLCSMIVGLVGYLMVRAFEAETAQSVVIEDVAQVESSLTAALDVIRQDLEILANTPPVQGLVRAMNNGGVDPLDARLTTSNWQEQLAANFAAFHHMRPDYLQIRFIGLADDGRELVRVNRTRDGTVEGVEDRDFQAKAQEDYFQNSLQLRAGETYRSAVSWNREEGQIETPPRAVFRISTPVFQADGTRFGMIVINVLAVPFTSTVLAGAGVDRDVVLSSGNGASFVFSHETGEGDLYLDNPERMRMIQHEVSAAIDATGSIFNPPEMSGAVTPFAYLDPSHPESFIAVMSPSIQFQQGSHAASRLVLIFIVSVTFMAMGVAYYATRAQLAPLNQINAAIALAPKLGERPDLPTRRVDEIGQLARSFDDMIGQLILREAMAKAIFDGVSEGMLICDSNGEIEDVNSALAQMLDRPRLSLVGAHLGYIFPQAQFDPNQSSTLHEWEVDSPSEMTSAEVSFSRIELAQGIFFAGVVRDTSDRKRRELKNHALVEALQESNSELDTFAHAASHDLKAPLRAIRTLAQWIEEDLEEVQSEEIRENFAILYTRIDRMTRLLDDLLQHAKIGRKTAEPADAVVTGEHLRTSVMALTHMPDGTRLTFDDGFDSIQIATMPVQIVLLNLISNALKHCPTDDLSIHVSVTVEADFYEFSVTDTGPGIPPEYHQRIFGMFETLKPRDEGGGSGMGLAICHKHVSSQGGRFNVISEGDGTGTSFVFTWPRPETSQVTAVLAGSAPKTLSA